MLYAVWRCSVGRGTDGTLRWLAGLTLLTFVAQVIVGAATIWLDFQAHWRALHLTAATAVWAGAVGMAVVAYLNARTVWGVRASEQAD